MDYLGELKKQNPLSGGSVDSAKTTQNPTGDIQKRQVKAVPKVSKIENPNIDTFGTSPNGHFQNFEGADILPNECPQHRATIWRIVTPTVDAHVITGTPITEREALAGYPDALSCVALDPPDPARQEAAPQPTLRASPEERITCRQCDQLASTGQCRAARRGEIPMTSRIYAPAPEILHRCLSFVPRPGAKDQRTGTQRWPRMARRLRAAQAQEDAA